MFNEDLNTLETFAYTHDEPGKLSGQLLFDTADCLPIILKRRYLDYVDKLGLHMSQPGFELLRKFIVHEQCWSTRVQYSYSSTTRVPFFEYSYSYSEPQVLGWYSYSKVNVLGTRSKKEPSTRVHLVFAKSNKQNEFLIVNCSQ